MSETHPTLTEETLTCEAAVELLPWLLNGSLDDDERQGLHRHLATCASCRQELDETARVFRMATWHVPSRALAEYAHGSTPSVGREEIERHLALCPSCSEEVELMRDDERVVDFAAARRRVRPARPAGRRLALAAAIGAMLVGGGLVWKAGKQEALQPQSAVVARTDDDGGGVSEKTYHIIDGFESGDTESWSSTVGATKQ